MSTSAALARYLQLNADYNYYVLQEAFYAQKHESMTALISKWEKRDSEWTKAQEDCAELEEGKTKTWNHKEYTYDEADDYADAKVGFSEAEIEQALEECTELDIEYDTMMSMYDALIEEIKTDKEATKSLVQKGAQDNGLLGGGG